MEEPRNLPAKEVELVGIPLYGRDEEASGGKPCAGTSDHGSLAPSQRVECDFDEIWRKIIRPLLNTGFHVIIQAASQSGCPKRPDG